MNIEYRIITLNTHLSKYIYWDVDLNALVKNINPESPSVTTKKLESFFASGGILVVAEHDNRIIGIVTLILSHKINSTTARVEHVAVSPLYRGRGVARKLLTILIREARSMEIRRLDLSCEPKRVEANLLYDSLGFTTRETNSRRLEIHQPL